MHKVTEYAKNVTMHLLHQDTSFSSCIQTQHQYPHFLIAEDLRQEFPHFYSKNLL